MDIYRELSALAQSIIDRGVHATLDPRDVVVPGAIVELNELGNDTMLCGDVAANANVYLIAADNGRAVATQTLLEMWDKVKDLTTGAQTIELTLPNMPALPTLKLNPIDLT